MAWPFASVGAPNLDTGPGVAVPTGVGTITASAVWLLGAHFTNRTGANAVTVTVTDTAGLVLCELKIPKGGEMPYEWPFRPTTGVKWFASATGALGHIWGYV
jgi:hypothetical protein